MPRAIGAALARIALVILLTAAQAAGVGAFVSQHSFDAPLPSSWRDILRPYLGHMHSADKSIDALLDSVRILSQQVPRGDSSKNGSDGFPVGHPVLVRVDNPSHCYDDLCPVFVMRKQDATVRLELIVMGGDRLTVHLFGKSHLGGPPAFPLHLHGKCSGLSLLETSLGWSVGPAEGLLTPVECADARRAKEHQERRQRLHAEHAKPDASWQAVFPNPGTPLGDERLRLLEQGLNRPVE